MIMEVIDSIYIFLLSWGCSYVKVSLISKEKKILKYYEIEGGFRC